MALEENVYIWIKPVVREGEGEGVTQTSEVLEQGEE